MAFGASQGAALPRIQLPVRLSHDQGSANVALAAVARSTGSDFGPDHAALLPLLRSGTLTTFGTW